MQNYKMTKITDIKPYEKNPRVIPDEAVEAVARSIAAFGFISPICVDKNGVILAGHTRYKAAQKLGLYEVPVVWDAQLDEAHAKGFRIADNKTAELAAWDRDLLMTEAREIAKTAAETVSALCLSEWEIEKIIGETISEPKPEPKPSAGTPIEARKTPAGAPFSDAPAEQPLGAPVVSYVQKARSTEGDAFDLDGNVLTVGGDALEADRIILRWQTATGKQARRIDGTLFDELTE